MNTKNNDPEQVNLGDDNHSENGIHKSQFNENLDKKELATEKEEEVLKPDDGDVVADNDKKDDKFSPGEPEGYNPDEFATE
jgi:hypothetical protein